MPVQTRSQRRRLREEIPQRRPVAVITAQPAPIPPSPPRAIEEKDAALCSICLETMCWPHRLRCGHAFHAACLQKWRLSKHSNMRCPMCRDDIFPKPWYTLCEQGMLAWMLWGFASRILGAR